MHRGVGTALLCAGRAARTCLGTRSGRCAVLHGTGEHAGPFFDIIPVANAYALCQSRSGSLPLDELLCRNSFKIERTEGHGKKSREKNEIGSRASAGVSQPLRRQPG
eukprot:4047219-Prymnesium_polylepis.2